MLELATLNSTGNGTWVNSTFRISDFLAPTANMTINVFANDKVGSGNVVEAGFDNFSISEGTSGLNDETTTVKQFSVFPNPFNKSFMLNFNAEYLTPNSTLSMVDLAGRTVYSTFITSSNMEVRVPEEIAKGIYILKAEHTIKQYSPVRVIRQ